MVAFRDKTCQQLIGLDRQRRGHLGHGIVAFVLPPRVEKEALDFLDDLVVQVPVRVRRHSIRAEVAIRQPYQQIPGATIVASGQRGEEPMRDPIEEVHDLSLTLSYTTN